MNRKDRRKQWKDIPGWMKKIGGESHAVQSMVRNGITAQDLENATRDGYAEGLDAGKQIGVRACYAAAALALNEEYGFGAQRVRNFLVATDKKVMYDICTDEMVDEIFNRFGFHIVFKGYDAIDGRVTE